jgi:hypothetical protein
MATTEANPFGSIVRRQLPSILAIGGVLAIWQIIASTVLAHAHILPGPAEIVAGIIRDWRFYPRNIAATGSVAIRGFMIGNPRPGFQVNGHFICRIWRRKSVFQLADFLRVLTLPLDLSARMRPSEKRRTTAMFLAPWPVR